MQRAGFGGGDPGLASAAPARQRGGQERYFPFIPEPIEDLAEVWVGFAENAATGRVAVRRRYMRAIEPCGRSNRRAGDPVTDLNNGLWAGITLFCGNAQLPRRMCEGLRIYERERK